MDYVNPLKSCRGGKRFLFFLGIAFAADHYAPVYYKEPLKSKALRDPVSALIALPFELVRWPIDKGLVYIEDNHIDRKALYIYDEMKEFGITPHVAFTDSAIMPLVGGNVDFVSLAGKKGQYHDLIAEASLRYAMGNLFIVDSELGLRRIGETGFYSSGTFNLTIGAVNRFYGSDRTQAAATVPGRMETIYLAWNAGYEFSPSLNLKDFRI